jgi:hypothetical protein
MLAMLQVDDANDATAAHQWNGQKRFVTVFRQFVEKLEARIVSGLFWNRNGLAVLGDPSGNTLPDAEFEAVDGFRMRVLGGAQDQFIAFKNVDEAGIAFHQSGGKFDDAGKHFVKSVARSQAHANLMEYINV